LSRAYYQNKISEFLITSRNQILGEMAKNHNFALDIAQKNAWFEQINNLQSQLSVFAGGEIFLEFSIPRMGKRVDVVLLIDDVVYVLEYKTGAHNYDRNAIDQVLDYALDLKNFHEGSYHKYIVPILISTKAIDEKSDIRLFDDKVAAPLLSNGSNLKEMIQNVQNDLNHVHLSFEIENLQENKLNSLSMVSWSETGYRPTPTIIEAAQALYKGHSVEEISRSDAGAENLTHTSKCIENIIAHSRKNLRKSICFVTGVPGAGKTLAGLNISTREVDEETKEHAVFLSGNGPLVAVLKEALARDEVERSKQTSIPISKKDALRKVSKFIQNIHHFRDEGIKSNDAPFEHVVVFDEAQRAWNQAQAQKFMESKKGVANFKMSEPEFLIEVMDRKEDWCTIICLIGGGQEINTGEAGLVEWFAAINKRFQHWDVYHSNQLKNTNYNWGEDLASKMSGLNLTEERALHLSVSIRSYRAESLSDFVEAVIDGDSAKAKKIYEKIDQYHLAITRDIKQARLWLNRRARGTERHGLIASSGAIRLKPEGIMVKTRLDPVMWFLNGKQDVRSSYYLEDVATEFDIQGLELDWTGVCWDADFRREKDAWNPYCFKGTKWQNINDEYRRVYLANSYRVLLTRARQGIVIFVPQGDISDYTRPPEFYNETFDFLKKCGMKEIS